ncbi:MAG: GAF domain-containing sensor histidine kinase [Planctomycetota bacterium]
MTESANEIATQGTAEPTLCLIAGLGLDTLTSENTETVLNEAIGAISEHFGADHGYIALKDNEGELVTVASISRGGQSKPQMTASEAVIDNVIQDGAGIVLEKATQSSKFSTDPDLQRFNIQSVICVPIKTADSTAGVIYTDSTDCRWSNSHLGQLEFMGRYMGMAVHNIRLQEKMSANKRLVATGNAALQLSHSVKNILQMIGGAAEIVDFGLRTNQIHRVKRSWDILKPNLERMRKYTLEMLDYSKDRPLNLDACDLNRVIQGAIESLKSQLKQKNSKLNIRIDQKIPTIELDGERIHEMALNIILNAIDIVDDEGGIVSVETKYLPEQNEVLYAVTDNGPGIAEEMREKIFTPFESKKSKFGTGLGMPIAKQVVDQHGGRIEIDTELGKGTTFNIYLPAKPVG